MDKTALEALVRQVLLERLGGGTHGVKAVQVPRIAVTEEHRMDTGNPLDRVYTRDLFTLQESPRLGVGVMEMTDTPFPGPCATTRWTTCSADGWTSVSAERPSPPGRGS